MLLQLKSKRWRVIGIQGIRVRNERKKENLWQRAEHPRESLLGFYYILPYYERATNFHKGAERDRQTETEKQERREASGCQCQTKATKEQSSLSSENAER